MPAERDPGIERRRPITVVLVDDERLIRGALAQMLIGAGFDLIGVAANMRDAVELVVALRPDVVLMDIGPPDSFGVRAIDLAEVLTNPGVPTMQPPSRTASDSPTTVHASVAVSVAARALRHGDARPY